MNETLPYKQIKIGDFIYVNQEQEIRPALVIGKLVKREQLILAFLEPNNSLPKYAIPLTLTETINKIAGINSGHGNYLSRILKHLGQLNTHGTVNLSSSYVISKLTTKEKFTYTSILIYN